MGPFEQAVANVVGQLQEELPTLGVQESEMVATWIVHRYRPRIVWVENDEGPFAYRVIVKASVVIAGKVFEYVGGLTHEMIARGHREPMKSHILSNLGRAVAQFLNEED